MTSSSSLGSVRINLQFSIKRDINGAARDVQAAINASRADLPTSLRSNSTYRKFNISVASGIGRGGYGVAADGRHRTRFQPRPR